MLLGTMERGCEVIFMAVALEQIVVVDVTLMSVDARVYSDMCAVGEYATVL